jgi:hypothetical protein
MWDNNVIWILFGFTAGVAAVFACIVLVMFLPDYLEHKEKNAQIKRLLKRAEDIDKMSK